MFSSPSDTAHFFLALFFKFFFFVLLTVEGPRGSGKSNFVNKCVFGAASNDGLIPLPSGRGASSVTKAPIVVEPGVARLSMSGANVQVVEAKTLLDVAAKLKQLKQGSAKLQWPLAETRDRWIDVRCARKRWQPNPVRVQMPGWEKDSKTEHAAAVADLAAGFETRKIHDHSSSGPKMRDERVAVARIDLPRIGDALGAAPRPAFERHAGRARRDACPRRPARH